MRAGLPFQVAGAPYRPAALNAATGNAGVISLDGTDAAEFLGSAP